MGDLGRRLYFQCSLKGNFKYKVGDLVSEETVCCVGGKVKH